MTTTRQGGTKKKKVPSVTRVPACTVKYCPEPRNPDWHRCFCGKENIHHHDAGAKGMGGGKDHHKQPESVVALCPDHHEALSTGECSDRILELPTGRTYVYYDTDGTVLYEEPLGAESNKPQWDANLRFWPKVQKTDKCWIWVGCHDKKGYGQIRVDGRMEKAHRVSYELAHGQIPDGLTIDHLCRNHPCVNPAHLEAVTLKENILRGESPPAQRAKVTHCPQGHPYDEQNTKIRPKGWRECRACAKASKLKPASGKKEEGDEANVDRERVSRDTLRGSGASGTSCISSSDRSAYCNRISLASSKDSADEASEGLPPLARAIDVEVHGPLPRPSSAPFRLEDWCSEGMKLVYWGLAFRDAGDALRFEIGDWFVKGEGKLGEEAYGYVSGFQDATVRQYAWVSARVSTRVKKLSWSHHRAVAALEEPKQKEWLDRALAENLTATDLNRAIQPKKPKVKRWTLDELRERAGKWMYAPLVITPGPHRVFEFLDWLEKEGT